MNTEVYCFDEVNELVKHEVPPELPANYLREKILDFEVGMSKLPGVHYGNWEEVCPLTHTFAGSMYVREMLLPKGVVITGRIHRFEHPFFLMSGDVSIFDEFKGSRRIQGPSYFVSRPGTKRVIFAHEDSRLVTVHHVGGERNIDVIEDLHMAWFYDDYDNGSKGLHQSWEKAVSLADQMVSRYRELAPEEFDPQATGIVAAIIAAGVLAAGASAYGSSQAASAQDKANQQNQAIANATNALNYQMFLQSRGSQGSAILPMYFTGSSTEQNLANQAYATYLAEQQALGTPEQQIAGYQAAVQGAQPAMQAGDQLVNQLFTDQLQAQQLANIQPIIAARGDVAAAQKTGILEGLSARLNALQADRARAGYTGGGSAYQKNLLSSATIPALQQAASVGAQANLLNATDVAQVKNQNIASKLNNLGLPLTQAQQQINLNTLPTQAAAQTFNTSLQPFNFFKISPQAFQAQTPPYVSPVPNTGQIAGQAAGTLASSLGNYAVNTSLINQLNNQTALQPGVSYTYVPQPVNMIPGLTGPAGV